MKTRCFVAVLLAFLSVNVFVSCSSDDDVLNKTDVDKNEYDKTVWNDSTAFNVDPNFIPTESYLQKKWAGEYEGWDEVQKKNTKIKRLLTLNGNRTYTNVIQGVLVASGKNDYVDFECESGTYTYNSRTGIITYSVTSDSIIQYKDEQFIGYSMKKYYDHQSGTYNEKANFSKLTNGKRNWVTKDMYLQSLTAEKIDLTFDMAELNNDK